MNGPGTRVSVIISTYNRSRSLGPALDALLAQRATFPYEVIVVDNNSTDETRQVVHAREHLPHLRYLFEPRRGLPHARNAGIAAAGAPLVAFTDDDVAVGPDWVATIKRTFEEHPDVEMIGGPVRPAWPSGVPGWVSRRQLGPFALGERGDQPIRVDANNAALCLVGANFAFRRSVFERVGPFDTAFTKSQDREIQLRLWRAGGAGLYVPDLSIDVEVPPDRLTKAYFRSWYGVYGVFHSRMRLLDSLDRDGRLVEYRGRLVLGVPPFVYRSLFVSLLRWGRFTVARNEGEAFFWENRARYTFSYVRERIRSQPACDGLARFDPRRLFTTIHSRRTPAA